MTKGEKRQGLQILENKLKESNIPVEIQAHILQVLADQEIEFRNQIYANMESYVTTASEVLESFVRNGLYYRGGLRKLFGLCNLDKTHGAAILSAFTKTEVKPNTDQA